MINGLSTSCDTFFFYKCLESSKHLITTHSFLQLNFFHFDFKLKWRILIFIITLRMTSKCHISFFEFMCLLMFEIAGQQFQNVCYDCRRKQVEMISSWIWSTPFGADHAAIPWHGQGRQSLSTSIFFSIKRMSSLNVFWFCITPNIGMFHLAALFMTHFSSLFEMHVFNNWPNTAEHHIRHILLLALSQLSYS